MPWGLMQRLFRSGRICDLRPSLFAGFHGSNTLCFPPTGNLWCRNTIGVNPAPLHSFWQSFLHLARSRVFSGEALRIFMSSLSPLSLRIFDHPCGRHPWGV